MAVDTRNKRASMIGIAGPARLVLPNPDATIDAADRLQFRFLYAGIAATAITSAVFMRPWRIGYAG